MPNINWLEFAVDFGILALFALAGGFCLWRAVRRPVKGPACPKCFYSMQMNQSLTCPECGHTAASPKDFTKRVIRKRWLVPTVLLFVPPLFGVFVVVVYYPQAIREHNHVMQLKQIQSQDERLYVNTYLKGTPNSHPVMLGLRHHLSLPYNFYQHGVSAPYHSLSQPSQTPAAIRWITYMFDYMEQPIWHLTRHIPAYQYTEMRLVDPLPSDLLTLSKYKSVKELYIATRAKHIQAGRIKSEDFKVLTSINSIKKLNLTTQINNQIAPMLISANPGLTSFSSSIDNSVDDATLKALGSSENLTIAHIGNVSAVNDEGFIALCQNQTIQSLSLNNLSVSHAAFEAISQLQSLESLTIDEGNLTDRHLPALTRLGKLKKLYIQHNPKPGITNYSAFASSQNLNRLRIESPQPIQNGDIIRGPFHVDVTWLEPAPAHQQTSQQALPRPTHVRLHIFQGQDASVLEQLVHFKNTVNLSVYYQGPINVSTLDFLTHMPDLETASLNFSEIHKNKAATDALFNHLLKARMLTDLSLNTGRVTQEFVDTCGQFQGRLNSLRLNGTRSESLSLQPLTTGKGFESLFIGHSFSITQEDIAALTRVPRLGTVTLLKITPAIDLKPLLSAPTITSLTLPPRKFTAQELTALRQQWPNVRIEEFPQSLFQPPNP